MHTNNSKHVKNSKPISQITINFDPNYNLWQEKQHNINLHIFNHNSGENPKSAWLFGVEEPQSHRNLL